MRLGPLRAGLLASLALATMAAVRPALPPGPAPSLRQERSVADAAARNAACVRCHVDEAEAHHASRHARSATNASFVAALEREPEARHEFCLDCHAPERLGPGRDPEAEALGVACVTCHVTLGAVLAAPGARGGPHGVLAVDWMAGPGACEGCHQFDYPGGDWPLQNTVAEAVELSDDACQHCHMRAPGTGHRFPGAYDAPLVASSVKTEAAYDGRRFTLRMQPTPPHAVPTGDLFRRLRLTIRPAGEAPQHRYFGRRFERRFDGVVDQLVPVADRRLHLRAERATVETSAPAVHWELVLERVASAPSVDPRQDLVEGSLAVAHGCVAEDGRACSPSSP